MKVEKTVYIHMGRWIIDVLAGESDPKLDIIPEPILGYDETFALADIARDVFFPSLDAPTIHATAFKFWNRKTDKVHIFDLIRYDEGLSVCVTQEPIEGHGYEVDPSYFKSYSSAEAV